MLSALGRNLSPHSDFRGLKILQFWKKDLLTWYDSFFDWEIEKIYVLNSKELYYVSPTKSHAWGVCQLAKFPLSIKAPSVCMQYDFVDTYAKLSPKCGRLRLVSQNIDLAVCNISVSFVRSRFLGINWPASNIHPDTNRESY